MSWVTGPAIKVASIVISQTGFANRAYAAEELVAELASAFLCAEFGINKEVRHASYIANWIELLRADDRAFFTAASQAQKAADYLRGLALTESLLETVA